MATLTLVRGLPGSGKSTYSKKLIERTHAQHFEADMFFEHPQTGYEFDFLLLEAAHKWCYGSAVRALWYGHDVVVSNTFTKMWELEQYLEIPLIVNGVQIKVVEMRTQFQNIHGLPEAKMEVMRTRWEQLPEDFPHFTKVIDQHD